MHTRKIADAPLFQFQTLSDFSGLKHYVSGRAGGVSGNEFSSLNLSFKVGDDPSCVNENRKRIQNSLSADKLLFPDQTHSANVVVVKTGSEDLSNADALITNIPGICISVMAADCVPILIFDPVKKVVAAIHSGWRGTVAGISLHVLTILQKEYQCAPSHMIACIGPSISAKVYEVGEDVLEQVREVFGADSEVIQNEKHGKGYLDLWKANKILLRENGIKKEHIELAGICTYTNHSDFFSARRSGNKTGRFAAGIMLD